MSWQGEVARGSQRMAEHRAAGRLLNDLATRGISFGVVEFVEARLSEDQWQAEALRHTTVDFDVESEVDACPASRSGPVGDLPWGEAECTCGVEPRRRAALDRVAALKTIATLHRRGHRGYDGVECSECRAPWACPTVLALAAAYRAHPDYERAVAATVGDRLRSADA